MSKKIKHILLITPFAPPQLGGAETHLEDLYEYLRNENYQVTVLTYQPIVGNAKGKSLEIKKNLTIYRFQWFGNNLFAKFENFPPIFNFLYITPYLFIRSFIYLLKHKKNTDLIHVFGLNAAFIARVLKIFFHKSIYFSAEALYDFKPTAFFARVCRWVLKGFDAVLVGSEESRDEMLRLGIENKKIVVYIHWIRLDNFKPQKKEKIRQELGWQNEFTALFVGRLITIKGIRLFIEAAKIADKNIQFKIVGDKGPELEYVMRAVKNMPNLEYVGAIANTEVGKYFAAADVYVYPALYNEDLARVLLESMAAGTPVINTNKGSGIYRLTPEVGFVVPADSKVIGEKIAFLYQNPSIAKKMSKASIKFAWQFGPKLGRIITNTYEKIYTQNN